MKYNHKGYTPERGDIVWIKFAPSSGRKIYKRRPGIVVSIFESNALTGFVTVCPITTTKRAGQIIVESKEDKVKGYVIPEQITSFDFIQGKRDIRYADQASSATLGKLSLRLYGLFGFEFIFEN